MFSGGRFGVGLLLFSFEYIRGLGNISDRRSLVWCGGFCIDFVHGNRSLIFFHLSQVHNGLGLVSVAALMQFGLDRFCFGVASQ